MPPLTAREPLPHLSAGDSFSTAITQSSDTSKWIEPKYSARLLILVCMCTVSRYYCRAYMPVLFVGSDALGCCWDFTARHAACHHLQFKFSVYEAIQWGRSSPLLLCVSLKTIIPRTCKLTLPFLMHLSIGTSEQVVSPLSERIFRWPFHRTHSVFCICLKLLTLAWSAVWLCGVTFMWPMMTPRQATGHMWVSAVLCLCCHCCWPSWTFFDPPQCFYSLVSVVTSPPACWTTVTSHTGTHTHAFILLYLWGPFLKSAKLTT